jgi:hypothetical protein
MIFFFREQAKIHWRTTLFDFAATALICTTWRCARDTLFIAHWSDLWNIRAATVSSPWESWNMAMNAFVHRRFRKTKAGNQYCTSWSDHSCRISINPLPWTWILRSVSNVTEAINFSSTSEGESRAMRLKIICSVFLVFRRKRSLPGSASHARYREPCSSCIVRELKTDERNLFKNQGRQ